VITRREPLISVRTIALSRPFLFPLVFLCWLLFQTDDAFSQAFDREQILFARRLTLYGYVEIAYDRRWSEGGGFQGVSQGEAITAFTQTYNLGLRGFIIDPRLVAFDVLGIFTDTSINPSDIGGGGFRLTGENVNLILLQKLPPRLLSSWKYIPHPITLRFLHYSTSGSNEYDQTQYGITLRHAMPEEIKYQRQQEKPGTRVVFPVTYFDYDRYDFKSADFNTKTNVYSLRSFLTGETYDYSVSYEHIDQTGTTEYTQDTLIFQPNYRFYNEATRRLLDITNVFRYQKIDERKDLELRSLQRWYKPIGPDTLQITGNLGYLKISPSDISASYIATVNANYTKVFSPRLTMIPFIQLNYGELNDRTISGGQVGNQVTGEISRYLRGTGNVFVGMNQNGAEYGIDGYVSTKTRVAATVGYAYSTLFPDDGKTVTNRFYINASGPIVSTLGFNTNGQYVIQDVSRSERPFNQTALLYSANLFWQFYQTALSLGGSYGWTKQTNGTTSEGSLTSVTATASSMLIRRLFLNFYGTWTKDTSSDQTQLDLRPKLSWTMGKTLLEVEYDYLKTTRSSAADTTDHRIFARFQRNFMRDFYLR
jgi:hypothetical protein